MVSVEQGPQRRRRQPEHLPRVLEHPQQLDVVPVLAHHVAGRRAPVGPGATVARALRRPAHGDGEEQGHLEQPLGGDLVVPTEGGQVGREHLEDAEVGAERLRPQVLREAPAQGSSRVQSRATTST